MVARRKVRTDAHILQSLIEAYRVEVQIFPVDEVYYYLTFADVESMREFLKTRLLEEWFSDIKAWEESDLADGNFRWVSLKDVPISTWKDQFFSFVVADFGWFLESSPVMVGKCNLKEA